jgi:hypothetical protein
VLRTSVYGATHDACVPSAQIGLHVHSAPTHVQLSAAHVEQVVWRMGGHVIKQPVGTGEGHPTGSHWFEQQLVSVDTQPTEQTAPR